ncbi:MAG: c-type cytochrome [Thiotrichales bacterium]
MNSSRYHLAAIALLASLPAVNAADLQKGETLHNAKCISCHVRMTGGDGSVLYTRSDRKVTSYEALETQVRRCDANLQTKWFDDDILSVTAYLNQAHYKFPAQ